MANFRRRILFGALALLAGAVHGGEPSGSSSDRQSLDDAWWTGPILAAGASTLPKGHFLFEPYLFDVVTYGRYDNGGERSDASDTYTFGSQTYLLYGLLDRITVGLIPRFGFNDLGSGQRSSGIRVGDLSLQGQYRLTQFREGSWVPTTSLIVQETLPIGKYHRLGDRPADAFGAGAYSTTLALYSQYYFWMPNGRILRTRLNLSYSFFENASVEDVSVYGTDTGFRGRARPGDSYLINAAWEYSVTRNWVLALDLMYQRDESTRVSGTVTDPGSGQVDLVQRRSRPSERIGLAPAIEYNWNSRVGVIVGARWFPAGRNAEASITPVAAINIVY